MVTKTFSIRFRLKKPKNYVKGPQLIYLRITVDKERVEISTQRECESSRWNASTGRVSGTREDVKILNAYLDSLQRKAYEAQQFLIDTRQEVTAEKIKNRMLGITESTKMILAVFQEHNDRMKALVGREFAPLTYNRYTTSLSHTREFIQWKFKKTDLEITRLNYEFISEYEFYLKGVRKCAHNSAMKYLANFKKIVLLCVKKGWLQKDPFYGFCLANREVIREFLTQHELDEMWKKRFATPRLTIVRDIFLFSCYTGLAYVDVHKLKRSEINIGIDGQKWIFTSRQKTEIPTRVPLLPICLEILQRYEDHPQCNNEDRVLPVWSNQKMNEYLKEIAEVCGIKKRLTYHTARHTFATTVTLNNGVPIETVAKMLGHRSLRTTQHYAKILDKKVSEDMKMLRDKLEIKRDGIDLKITT